MKQLPNNTEIEQSIIGIVLLDCSILNSIEIDKEYFYYDIHKTIWETIQKIWNNTQKVDLVILSKAMKDNGTIDMIGGSTYLMSCMNSVVTTANYAYYIDTLKKDYNHRQLI